MTKIKRVERRARTRNVGTREFFRAGPPGGAHRGSSDSLRRPLPRTVYTPINHPPPSYPVLPFYTPRHPSLLLDPPAQ